ncbi:hypothetical protein GCM10007418_09830 [Halopseudomonas salina]|uniref:Uncharacterized protein n=1 Tax=Halopseudomonas salina TaxID=1323744 RepID=A0ABQ1PAK1_9GAMM|nr:hypothetical protein GCM10007418_09830 [Halopseudomonas salina]
MGVLPFLRALQTGFYITQALVAVENIVHRTAFQVLDFLLHMRDSPVCRKRTAAGVCAQLAAHQRKKTRFSCPIGAQQADFLARVQGEVGVFQEAQWPTLER